MQIYSAAINRLRQTFEWIEIWKWYKYNAMADVIIFDLTVEHNTMLMQCYGSWDASSLPSAQAELVHISASEDKRELLRVIGMPNLLSFWGSLEENIFYLKRWHTSWIMWSILTLYAVYAFCMETIAIVMKRWNIQREWS